MIRSLLKRNLKKYKIQLLIISIAFVYFGGITFSAYNNSRKGSSISDSSTSNKTDSENRVSSEDKSSENKTTNQQSAEVKRNPDPNTSNNSTAQNSPSATFKCIDTDIVPYKTTYSLTHDSSGSVTISEFKNGYTTKCTGDLTGYMYPANMVYPPIDKHIYIGDGGASLVPPINTGRTYEDVYAQVSEGCKNVLSKTNDNTAYQMCIDPVMKYYGF